MGLVPDPTLFITRNLDTLIPNDEEIAVAEFRECLGKICPVIDGGAVREKVLKKINAAKKDDTPWPKNRLSDSLSFALRCLKKNGLLDYWCRDDQRTFLRMSQDEKIAFLSCAKKGG
jgi:hypothetical protein